MHRLSRRDVLKAAPAALPFLTLPVRADEPPAFPGSTVRMHSPQNLEYPFSELKSWITPNEQFFVRSHFAAPKIDPKTHTIAVEGAVENKLTLTTDDLRKLQQVTMPLTLECAGNGRVFLAPQAPGLQWGFGGVSNAEWTGVPLAAVLEKAGVKAGAVEVVLVGADQGVVANPPSPGSISFARSVPLEKARKPEVLLAHQMNGEDLPPSHGAPVRAVVGGWYGMASVKWLAKIIVVERPYRGFWQTLDYSYFERRDGFPDLLPVTRIEPKALIARPALNSILVAGKPVTIAGAAWAGESAVAKVEVSTDGGESW
jgi:DMSO/TMAO reductase YedYZ molybdopterin-dependent catalytic subunit